MRHDDQIRLRHMLDAAIEARRFCKGKSRQLFNADRMLVLSVIKSVEIVGEAASKVSEITRAQTSDIPWEDIVSMRNRLIHGYFDVNLDIVWETVNTDLPRLIRSLEKALDQKT
jgi:uncharacterized protein with HEPN domain